METMFEMFAATPDESLKLKWHLEGRAKAWGNNIFQRLSVVVTRRDEYPNYEIVQVTFTGPRALMDELQVFAEGIIAGCRAIGIAAST